MTTPPGVPPDNAMKQRNQLPIKRERSACRPSARYRICLIAITAAAFSLHGAVSRAAGTMRSEKALTVEGATDGLADTPQTSGPPSQVVEPSKPTKAFLAV